MIEPYWGAEAPREAPFVINVFARFYGQSILSHYPCGLDCTRSILLGYQYLSCLEAAEPALAERLRSSARCEVAISPTVGLWASRWTGGGGAPRRVRVTSAVPWVSKTEDAWMFAEGRVAVELAPGGIVLSNEAGQRRFVAAHSFHLH